VVACRAVVRAMEAARTFLDKSLSKGKIEIPSSELAALYEKFRTLDTPPVKYVIETQTIHGMAQKDHVALTYELSIRVLGASEHGHWVKIPLLSDQLTVFDFKIVEGPIAESTFGIMSSKHTFLTRHDGLYKLRIEGQRSFTSDKKCGVKVDLTSCSRSVLNFVVMEPQLDIAVNPCVSRSFASTGTATTVTCHLQCVNSVDVQWTAKQVCFRSSIFVLST